MDRGAWRATVHGVEESWMRLGMRSQTYTHTELVYNVVVVSAV